jgi:hypothetical protein
MSRPADRSTLLARIDSDFQRLVDEAALVPAAARTEPGACDGWSVKDILAHLDAWHELFLGWERVGRAGDEPELPAPGYSWKQTPALNSAIWARTKDDAYVSIEGRLVASHEDVRTVVASYADEELFERARYGWTGTTSVGSYAVSATTSHYEWATKLIRRFRKGGAYS